MFPEVTVEYLIATVVLETSILIMLNDSPLIDTCCESIMIVVEELYGIFW